MIKRLQERGDHDHFNSKTFPSQTLVTTRGEHNTKNQTEKKKKKKDAQVVHLFIIFIKTCVQVGIKWGYFFLPFNYTLLLGNILTCFILGYPMSSLIFSSDFISMALLVVIVG
jgi:hypothetical protein